MADQEGNGRHESKKGNKFEITPFNSLFTHFQRPALGKGKWQGTALKGQRPHPEKEKGHPVHSFCNTQPSIPYAVPQPSAALR